VTNRDGGRRANDLLDASKSQLKFDARVIAGSPSHQCINCGCVLAADRRGMT
jgi:hypothetical protein